MKIPNTPPEKKNGHENKDHEIKIPNPADKNGKKKVQYKNLCKRL